MADDSMHSSITLFLSLPMIIRNYIYKETSNFSDNHQPMTSQPATLSQGQRSFNYLLMNLR